MVSVTQPLVGGDLLDPSVFVSESTMAMFNHLHVLITRQKVIEKMRYMALQGKCPGGRPPLGYDLDADPPRPRRWTELENVQLYRQFFADHAGDFAEASEIDGEKAPSGED